MWSKFLAQLEKINDSKMFQTSVVLVIVVSALSIGAKTHNLTSDLVKVLAIADIAITLFFVLEIVIRYLAIGNFRKFFTSGWNIFDTFIVIGSLIPSGSSGILLARLLRVFRVLRLVSMVPELRLLINALLKAIPRMGYIALLMFVIFYIYGAVGSILFEQINPVLWGDVSIAMLTLFRIATFEDWTDVMYETMEVHPLSWIYYLSFIFLTAFVFLNMMVGTVLDVMQQEHERDRADSHGESIEEGEPASRAQVDKLQQELEQIKQLLIAKNIESANKKRDS
ncbi:MAG: ion transporter [Kangiellaceae bacterium]|nr:ion transporter [Kangiellaceae bacterium]